MKKTLSPILFVFSITTNLFASEFTPINFNPTCEDTQNNRGTIHNHYDHVEPDLLAYCKEKSEKGIINVLSYGAGNGRVPIKIHMHTKGQANVYINDLNAQHLMQAYNACKGQDGIKFDFGSCVELKKRVPVYKGWPSLEGGFDVVTSFNMLHFLTPIDTVQHVADIYSNLKPNGRAFFIFQIHEFLYFRESSNWLSSALNLLSIAEKIEPHKIKGYMETMVKHPIFIGGLVASMRYTVARYNVKNGIAFANYNPIEVTDILKYVPIFGNISVETTPVERAENCIFPSVFNQMVTDFGFKVLDVKEFSIDIDERKHSSTSTKTSNLIVKPPFVGFTLEKRVDFSNDSHAEGLDKWKAKAKNHKSNLAIIHKGKELKIKVDFPHFEVVDKK